MVCKLELSFYVDLTMNFGNIFIFPHFYPVVLLLEKYLEISISRSLFGDTGLTTGMIMSAFQ